MRRYNGRLNAFILVLDGEEGFALSRARELDSRLTVEKAKKKNKGQTLVVSGLFGVPLVIKDNFSFGGFPTTNATYYFKDYVPNANAELVDAVLSQGCVPLGKTNMHELALGATSAASYFGPVRNPHDEGRVSGGSSGGSAVAVSISEGPVLGLGTDTGGSIRVPAALCGVMGFKPTLGSLSLEGIFPLSATLDHAGLLTRTMPDMLKAFWGLSGGGRKDVTREREAPRRPRGKLKVGVPSAYFLVDAEERVSRNFWRAVERMEASGDFATIEVQTDSTYDRFVRARGVIQLTEASWFYRELIDSRRFAEKMNPDVLTLLRRGAAMGDLRYMGANLVRLESIRVFERLLRGLDLLAMPTTRIVAPKLDDVLGNETGRLRRLLLQNTEVFNLCGFPALSVPTSERAAELPTAMQLVGRLGEDEKVLHAGDLAVRAIVR